MNTKTIVLIAVVAVVALVLLQQKASAATASATTAKPAAPSQPDMNWLQQATAYTTQAGELFSAIGGLFGGGNSSNEDSYDTSSIEW